MSTLSSLDILAGPDALEELRDTGLRPERVRSVVGASGGPKWLVLHGLDRVVFPWLLAGAEPHVHAVGSSIGSWRLSALCTRSPVEALDRFAEAYLAQRYGPRPTPEEVSAEGQRILDKLLGPEGCAPVLAHPTVRLHVVTARFRHLGALESRLQWLGLGFAALSNAVDRRALSASLERVVFDAVGDPGPYAPWGLLPTRHVRLTEQNLKQALAASSAIPRVMAGVRNPEGAPAGIYRDGGTVDYHFGSEIDLTDGLTLYPHFYPHLVPGWFDKVLPHRRTRGLRRVVVLAPSESHVASLPNGRIPDRNDFYRMDDATRIQAWQRVLELGQRMADAFSELCQRRTLSEHVRPL